MSFVRDVGLQTAHEFTLFATGDGLIASQSVRITILAASEEDPYLYSDDSLRLAVAVALQRIGHGGRPLPHLHDRAIATCRRQRPARRRHHCI